jgi:uncharacterized membrane protein
MTKDEILDLSLIAIVVMAAVTFAIRAGGFWLMGRVELTARVRRMLEALPGSIVAAVVLPIATTSGVVGTLSVVAAVAVMSWRGNALVAVGIGTLIAALVRSTGM